jgi:AcrR family transcriptional regulator
MPGLIRSTKQQIVLTAERLFATRGLEGVSLRQIGIEAGNGNNSAVQYHFGTKEQLVQAIFEYRLPELEGRRQILMALHPPNDLRSWIECYVLPILEQGEQPGSHYLSFVAMLQQHADRHLFDRIPPDLRASTERSRDQITALLVHMPEPLRTHRLMQAITFSVHASADRERAQMAGHAVLPFGVHVVDLLDGLIGFLEAPVSEAALSAVQDEFVVLAGGLLPI